MIKVAVCICTKKRPAGIITLLKSIEALIVPKNIEVIIIIVENDVEPYTQGIIEKFASESKLQVQYFVEKNQGISFARNRSVKEAGNVDFCCFVDDDQVVEPEWLSELLKCQHEFKADGVWGPNPPLFSTAHIPDFIIKFHQPCSFLYGTIVNEAFTNCLLIKKSWLDKFEGPFDLRLNFTGGEDRYLTNLITRNGGIIRFNPNAKAIENIPENRATIQYVIKRTIKMANTRYYVNSLLNIGKSRLKSSPRIIARFCFGLLITLPCFFTKNNKLVGLIRVCDAIGGLIFVFGIKNNFYK